MSNQQHCDAMYEWLARNGINSHRHEIIQAVAEKAEQLNPSQRLDSKARTSLNIGADDETEWNIGGLFFLLLAFLFVVYSVTYM